MALNKKIELLAPAGDYDSFRAAVENGADAVYLGGKLFNARQLAGNFDLEKLKDVINYAHARGVNIYLTMNTLISDDEMKAAVEFAKEAWLLGIDGIIVQDMGFAGILHKVIPGLPLHASTQMSVHNLEGVRTLEALGFKRVVLARELSLDEIREIAKGTEMEIEVFVHGALCISYSGQCLMSSIIGGRSGNRGKCAQPCRLPYKLIDEKGEKTADKGLNRRFLLSPKDLCTLEDLDSIVAAGVKSLKIEGRMKSPEYVATVVRIYKKVLDGNDGIEKDILDLTQIFNRGGFSRGYLRGKPGQELMCYEKPKNWGVYLGEVQSYDKVSGIIRVKLQEDISIGDGMEVWNDEEESPGTIITLIRKGGKNVREATVHDMVELGTIRGKIFRGCRIYKTSDKRLLLKARESFEGRVKLPVKIKAVVELKYGKPLTLKVFDDEGNKASAEGSVIPEKAANKPLTPERLSEQLKKTGATIFEVTKLDTELDEGLSLPVSEINDVRRKALDKLEYERILKHYGKRERDETEKAIAGISFYTPSKNKTIDNAMCNGQNVEYIKQIHKKDKTRLAIMFYEDNFNKDYASIGADRVYLPFKALFNKEKLNLIKDFKYNGSEVFVWFPVIMRGNYMRLFEERRNELAVLGFDGILTGNIGVVEMLKYRSDNKQYHQDYPGCNGYEPKALKDLKLMGDYHLNVFNTQSAWEYKNIGLDGITLSPELTLQRMCSILEGADIEQECMVYGRLTLMNMEYCPVGCINGGFTAGVICKGNCSTGKYYLKDRLGYDFPVACDNIDCRSSILNSNVLFAPDAAKKLADAGAGTLRLCVWDESPEAIGKLVGMHRDIIKGEDINKYSGLIEGIKSAGFTKGHFFRGV